MLPLLDLHAVHMSVFVLLAPLLAGIVKKTKAFMSTRRGAPVWQPYLDLWKLFRRPIVLSRTASRVFGLSTPIVLGTALVLAAATPLFSADAPLKLNFVLFIYLMALPRFFQILAGLDTGSAFGGLGSSREATVAAMAEPALLLTFGAIAHMGGADSLGAMLAGLGRGGALSSPAVLVVAGALFLLMLAENARIPIDDPATHLELTMIHEAMVLDHSGLDLGMIQLAAALRLTIFSALFTALLWPGSLALPFWQALPAAVLRIAACGVVLGVVESSMARLRLSRVPSYLLVATVLAALGLALSFTQEPLP